jgi:tRNA-dihydrouridine synthase B
MFAQTGCDGVMIGRAAQGNPWLFRQVRHYLQTGEVVPGPTPAVRLAMLLRHLDMLVDLKGEHIAIREMRRHAAWYTKGLPRAAEFRVKLNQAVSKEDFCRILLDLREVRR